MISNEKLDLYLNSFGEFLERSRKERGWSSYRLNGETGVSASAIRYLELNQRKPTLEMIIKLSHGLGLKPSEFLHILEKEIGF